MNDTFCVLPFTHLATHPDGEVTPCCESNFKPRTNGKILNLNTDSIEDIRNSDSFNQLKQDLKNGIQHSACTSCWKVEKSGLKSKRIRENDKFGLNDFSKSYFEQKQPLINVELRLGNICNMKCLICHPGSSSKWNEDTKAFKGETDVNLKDYANKVIIPKEWYRNDTIYENMANQPELKNLWFNGGEPTLIKEHFNLLKKLIENGVSKKITLDYTLNGSYMPDELLMLWGEFKQVGVTISLDDIGDRVFYSRYPTNFSIVEENIKKLEMHSITYTLIPTISLLNIFNVVNIYNYFDEHFSAGNLYGINFVNHPYFLSIGNLSNNHKKIISNNIKNSNLPSSFIAEIEHHMSEPSKVGYGSFIKYINTTDKTRKIKITEYLTEFKELFSHPTFI
tara:strand:+ start:748 stop:1929 length:1182 start_codon:yes stop_codon:yes gene_type:complete